jgi:hypothetical protein
MKETAAAMEWSWRCRALHAKKTPEASASACSFPAEALILKALALGKDQGSQGAALKAVADHASQERHMHE